MDVAVVANRSDPEAGYVGERLEALGGRLRPVWREEPERLVAAAAAADVVVLLGSSWSVASPRHPAALTAEQQVVVDAHAAGQPLLGICYGAQLAASVFGATVERMPATEVGWVTLDSADPLLAGPWFELHDDRWRPDGPLRVAARSAAAPQAFVEGSVIGWQFHPEVTPDVVARWVGDTDLSPAEADALVAASEQHAPSARARCAALVDAALAHWGAPAASRS